MMFPIFSCFIVFILWFFYKRKKVEKAQQNTRDEFWQKEYAANHTPQKSIEHLHYITIRDDMLPFLEIKDPEILEFQKTIQALKAEKIVNLSYMTNTDLKLAYGTRNYPLLSKYDRNFSLLIRTLYSWGRYLHGLGMDKEAIMVLEYGISCGTDITAHYLLLAGLYRENHEDNKLKQLAEKAESLNSPVKNKLLQSLKELC